MRFATLGFVASPALLGQLAQCVSEIARGALDAIGCGLQSVGFVRRALRNDSQCCLDLLSQTICLIFSFLFCAGFL